MYDRFSWIKQIKEQDRTLDKILRLSEAHLFEDDDPLRLTRDDVLVFRTGRVANIERSPAPSDRMAPE
jgi:hypothetical protein